MRNSLIALSSIALLVSCSSGTRTTQASPSPAQVPAPTPTAPVAAEMRRDSAARPGATGTGGTSLPNADPFPSTYRPVASRPTVIRNVTILTAAGPTIRNGAVLLANGKISQVGATVNAPSDAIVVDGTGKYVTPGIIDTHSHIGGGAAPGDQGAQTDDINEATNPVTANVWVEHSVWPQDPQFTRSLAGGVTTIQVLPGSANIIGGRSVVLNIVPSRTVQGMKFPGAEYGLKMACGENQKHLYAREGISASVWADWGAFKLEAADAVRANMALLDHAGVRAIVHSDDASGEQRLNQEAAKGMAEGNRIGVPIDEDKAIKWLTINPAWALGLDDRIGSIEVGKNADVVLWSGDPFSVYSRAEKVWIDGGMIFDRLDPAQRWRTDFELGFVPENAGGNR